ncbi:hypothetical protein JNL27_04630, partial [bacterium]|nr:hypothetical protein [bacterium]
MKKLLLFSLFTLFILPFVFYYTTGHSQTGSTKKIKLQKPDIMDQVRIGVNNWSYVMQNNGIYMLDSKARSGGGEFPRSSGRILVYSGGFNLGVITGEYPIKVVTNVQPSDGGSQMRPGAIINSGVPFYQLVASDPNSADNRVYYINDTHSEPHWPGLVDDKG